MPPKSPAKGKGKKGPPPEPPKTVEQLANELADKELQIKDLQAGLSRALEEAQEQTTRATQKADETERAKSDLHDINEFLTNQLKGSAIKVASLEARIRELDSKLAVQDKANQAAVKQLNAEWAQDRTANKAAWAARDEESAQAQAALAEQTETRAALEAAQEAAQEADRSSRLKVQEVERQAAEFKERVRRHAEQQMADFEAEARTNALSNSSKEYASLSKTLQGTRKELEELAQQATSLLSSETFLRRELELARGRESDYAKRTAMFKRAIALLTQRVKSAEAQRQQHAQTSTDMHAVLSQLEQLAQDATLKASDSTQENTALKRELQTLRNGDGQYRQPVTLGEEFMGSLTACINDILRQRSELVSPGGSQTAGQQRLTFFERQALSTTLTTLQDKLNKELPKKEAGLRISLSREGGIGAWPSAGDLGRPDSNLSEGMASSLQLKLTDRSFTPDAVGRTIPSDSWAASPLPATAASGFRSQAPDEAQSASGTAQTWQDDDAPGLSGGIMGDPSSASAVEQERTDPEDHDLVAKNLEQMHDEIFRPPIRQVYDRDIGGTSRRLLKKVSRVAFTPDTFAEDHESRPVHRSVAV